MESELSLLDLLAGLRRHLLAFVVCALGGAFLAGLVSLFLTPVYVASARLLVEEQSSAGGLMTAALSQLPGGLSSLVGGAPQTVAEIEMLRSRPVATSVVLPAGSDGVAPDVGQNLLVRVDDLALQSLWLAALRVLSGASEPEGTLQVEVESWEFPEDFDDALLLDFQEGGSVDIAIDRWFDRRKTTIAWRPGEPLRFEDAALILRPTNVAGDVAADALAGRSFRVTVGALQKTVEDFLENLEVKEPQRGSNVLRIAYPDSDAERSAAVVNALVAAYRAHNRARISNRASRPALFLEGEIQRIREELTLAEEELSAFGREAGPVVLPESAVRLVERLAEIDLERARLDLSATATAELVARYDAGEVTLRELAGLEEVLLVETPPAEPLSALLAQKSGLEALYNEDWPELRAATAVVEDRIAALRTMLASRVTAERRLSADLDQIQARYQAELENMPQAAVELLRFQRKVEAFSQIYLFLVGQLQEAKIREATAVPALDVIEGAVVPRKRSRPRLVTNTALGLVLGLAFGVVWAFGRELRRPLSSELQMAAVVGAPPLAVVAHARGLRSAPLAVRADPDGAAAHALRGLRAGLTHAARAADARRIVVVSAQRAEGRSLVAANLALSLAGTGARVFLIDADERRPVQSEWFAVAAQPGLAALLEGELSAVQGTEEPGLHLVAAGALPPGLADRVGGAEAARALEQRTAEADWVIVDTAPCAESSLATGLAAWADGVLVVGRAGRTLEGTLTRTAAELERAGARVLGVVLTDA